MLDGSLASNILLTPLAALIPDEKCLVLTLKNFSSTRKNPAGYYSRTVTPSTADGASMIAKRVALTTFRKKSALKAST